ncbi:hypothetical protein Q7P37_008661 [Cladosporium fusiforme]
MSGNPFRRPAPSRPQDESAIDDNDLDVPKSPPKTKNGKPKKRVQIISPPQSPVESPERPRRLSDGKTGSPPPPPVNITPEDVAATNATSTADTHLQQAFLNTQRNSDGSAPLSPPVETGTMRAPYNPFARTLATADSQYGLQRATTEEQRNEKQTSGAPPKMNVDMFKNILMTGSASPSPPVAPPTQPSRPQDSSSSTDTSSVSRQSLFDPAHELHLESPRTSFDQHSISDEEEAGDNEHAHLMGPTVSRPEAEGPPPPPKHRHGKALGPKGPQTVSFADFHESIPTGWQQPPGPRTPPVNSALQGILRPSTPRSPSSDLNKPLPVPPEARPASEPSTEGMEGGISTIQSSPPPHPEAPQAKKIPPPPPPTARRQGGGRSRSGSNLTQNSIQEEDGETPKPTPKAVPPPPPSRRTHNPPAQPSPSVETPPVTQPGSPSLENRPTPPPPRRNPSKSGSHARSPSNASSNSIPRMEGGAPPPAPPPRRGAAPKRNSIGDEYKKSHDQSQGSETSSLRQIDEAAKDSAPLAEPQQQRDMLADLAALQAEVDALRAKAGHG